MKIVVLDGYTENPGDLSWEALARLGELEVYDRTSYVESPLIPQRMRGAQIVVSNKTPISRQTIEQCPELKLICLLSTGYNVVDWAFARERGIPVCNVPTYGTASVAQYAIALLLEICHHVGHHSRTVREGKWAGHIDWCYWDYPLVELAGKTAGIIGFGRIGQATAAIAKALGMQVLACDPYPTPAGRLLGEYVELDQLLNRSDVVFLHCNLTAENAGMIGREAIEKMKDGAILINNARGQLLDEQAVARALAEGKLAAAGVDVASTEPIREDNPLLTAPNCIITPHMSWGAREARRRIMDTTADNIRAFMEGAPVNVVN